jgi:hypothetical protein
MTRLAPHTLVSMPLVSCKFKLVLSMADHGASCRLLGRVAVVSMNLVVIRHQGDTRRGYCIYVPR